LSGSTISIAVFAGLTGIVISGASTMMDSAGIAASEDSMASVVSAAGIASSAAGIESSVAGIESFAAAIEGSTAATEGSVVGTESFAVGTESSVAGSGVSEVEASEAFTAVTAPSRGIAGSTVVKAAEVSFMVEGVAAMVAADPTAVQLMGGN